MEERIYLSPPHISGREMKYIQEAFDMNWVAPIGPNVDAFEKEIAEYLTCGHVAALSSGTAAIHLALINLGITTDDIVLVSSLTFSATVNPIVYQGAIPVFVDSEIESWNICPNLLRKAIIDLVEKGKKPKAIIAVHIYGVPARVSEIKQIADEFEIPLIEDAAESMGSKSEGRFTGTIGSMGILSFNGNKIMTTSGGGALISDNEEFIRNARFLSTQARDNFPFYHHTHIGYNYRMSNIVAGIGRGQLEVLSERIEKRRAIFEFYRNIFEKISGVSIVSEPEQTYANRWLTTVLIDPVLSGGRTHHDLLNALSEANIEARYVWKPMHTQPVFAGYPAYLNGISEHIFNHGLCLPSGSGLTDYQLGRIRTVIEKVFAG